MAVITKLDLAQAVEVDWAAAADAVAMLLLWLLVESTVPESNVDAVQISLTSRVHFYSMGSADQDKVQ